MMLALPMGMIWAAYAVGWWGWKLLKGCNITFLEAVNPLNPYIDKGQCPPVTDAVFPSGTPPAKAGKKGKK